MPGKQIPEYLGEADYVRQAHEMSETGLKFSENRRGLCLALKEIRQTGNLDELIHAESQLVTDHLSIATSRNPVWQLELDSLTLADEQMARGLRCYDLFMNDLEAYKIEMERHDKLAKDKYPLDPFRVFLGAQRARLQNALKMPYTEGEKTLLETRLENVNFMHKLYKSVQKERLPRPVRERGELGRYMLEREN